MNYYSHTCACGCGGQIEVKKHHEWKGIPKYILGHSKNNFKHGFTKIKLHKVWRDIKDRCLNIKVSSYKDYGGRGITICPEWANDYIAFRDWAINNGYSEELQINRINNDGNYEPFNCNFLTAKENTRNRRGHKIKSIEMANEIRDLYKAKKYTQREIAKIYGVSFSLISQIINNKRWNNEQY